MAESFEEFRRSFSYGSRSDLNFKFLKALSDDDAATFFSELLDGLGEAYDHGDLGPLVELAIDWQIRGYTPDPDVPRRWRYDDGPFTTPSEPVSASRVALLTSSGHFVAGDDPRPFGVDDMSQEEAEERIDEFLRAAPTLSRIPIETAHDELRVRHGGYDITSAAIDPGVAFPVAALQQLEADGTIGELHPEAFSFPGATAQRRIIKESGPEWTRILQEAGVDVVLLVPV